MARLSRLLGVRASWAASWARLNETRMQETPNRRAASRSGQPGEPVAEDQGVEADGDGDEQEPFDEDPPVAEAGDALGLEVRRRPSP